MEGNAKDEEVEMSLRSQVELLLLRSRLSDWLARNLTQQGNNLPRRVGLSA